MKNERLASGCMALCLLTGVGASADESLSDFMHGISRMTAPVDRMLAAPAACAHGNDQACSEAGIDSRHPCRPYAGSPADFQSCVANVEAAAIQRQIQQPTKNLRSGSAGGDPCSEGVSSFYDSIGRKMACIQSLSEACNVGDRQACATLDHANTAADRMSEYAKSQTRSVDRINRMRQSNDAAEARRRTLERGWIGSDGIERHYDPDD